MNYDITSYESKALDQIRVWKSPKPEGVIGKALKLANWPTEKASRLVMAVPGLGWAIEKSFSGLMILLNDGASWTVRTSSILNDFQKHGHPDISGLDAISTCSIEEIDHLVKPLALKYKSIALAEGTAGGAIGGVALPADVVAVIALNLRAIGEYATYYGFDIAAQEEKLFMMNILILVSSPD